MVATSLPLELEWRGENMMTNEERRHRLERLLDLAQVYRGWTRRELAKSLGRDPTKLVPGSGNPKLDLIVSLAEVLDWSIGEVTECLWAPSRGTDKTNSSGDELTFDDLDELAGEAYRRGDYREMIRMAVRARNVAGTAEERARSWNRELGGWDGLGRFNKTLDAAREALRENPISDDMRRLLQSNLANAYYVLWHLTEARTTACDLIDHYRSSPPATDRDRRTLAFSHYVLGHTHRRLIDSEPAHASRHAKICQRHLTEAQQQFELLATEMGSHLNGIARTCRGGILEAEVLLGSIDARLALAEINDCLNEAIDPQAISGDDLESYGWWCIFGCNITLRHITDERDLQRHMALFTNKADEVANILDNWAMRERVFSMQYAGHRRFVGWTGQPLRMTIDSEDIKMITGTMGRFPQFRQTGWNMLENACVVNAG
ncbi:MAG: hypothetical protein CMJ39_13235 [Phycisphaerae bacterium]|nr:hypothetical protein [Phycisphaerae bacterium]